MSDTYRSSVPNQPPTRWSSLLAIPVLLLGGFTLATLSDRAGAADSPPEPQAAHAHHAHAEHAAAAPAAKPAASSATARPSAAGASRPAAKGAATAAPFTGDRAETERLIGYDNAITLTPEQEAVRVEALTPLPAPCCKEFSAATCCCRCNMKRASDGLAKHLIATLGADAVTVRAQVASWQKAINPNGFSGDVCATGGCGRAFKANGCGGMTAGQLVF